MLTYYKINEDLFLQLQRNGVVSLSQREHASSNTVMLSYNKNIEKINCYKNYFLFYKLSSMNCKHYKQAKS